MKLGIVTKQIEWNNDLRFRRKSGEWGIINLIAEWDLYAMGGKAENEAMTNVRIKRGFSAYFQGFFYI